GRQAVGRWIASCARRAFATSIATVAQMAGLVVMPLVAQLAIGQHGWRYGWLAIGSLTLLVGFLPVWLFMARRPEGLGLRPDRSPPAETVGSPALYVEPNFSRREAIGNSAFWLLLLYTILVHPVQAGGSLHQAAHLIERGIDPTIAATVVSTFSLMSAVASISSGFLPRSVPMRYPFALIGLFLAVGALLVVGIVSAKQAYIAAAFFGFGIGGVLTLLPIAWADYFGRANFAAIRSVALSAQVIAQAAGPLLSGALHDLTGNYVVSLRCFAALSALSVLTALIARRPISTESGKPEIAKVRAG